MLAMATDCRKLGRTGPEVFPIGLGCMGMSGVYGAASDAESLATIQAAIDAGVNLLDTSDFYSTYSNEMLIGRALRSRRDQVVLSVTFNAQPAPYGLWQGISGRQAALKTELTSTMKRLGVSHIDIYRLGRLNPDAPIEETLGTISEMVKAGYVRHIGLSGLGPEAIRRASLQCPIVDCRVEYSLANRAPETKIFPKLEELGLGATVYGVLSRGLFSGQQPAAAGDVRAQLPRFKVENLERARQLAIRLKELAGDRGVTPARLAMAWVLARQDWVVPLIGVRTRTQLTEMLGALELNLTAEEVAAIQAPVREKVAVETRVVVRQMETQERPVTRTHPVEAVIALPVKPAVEKLAAIETPVVVVEEPAPVQAVAEPKPLARQVEIPVHEESRRRPAEAAIAPLEKPAVEKIAAIDAPALAVKAVVPAVEVPIPLEAAAETLPIVDQIETPASETAPMQPVEPASALPVIPAAAVVAAIEAPAQAVVEAIMPGAQIETPESATALEQPVEPANALHVMPAEDEIAAIEAQVLVVEALASAVEVPIPFEAAAETLPIVEQIETPASEPAPMQPVEPASALPVIPAAAVVAAIEAPILAIEAPATSQAVVEAITVGVQIEFPIVEKAPAQPALAASAPDVKPRWEEISVIEMPVPAIAAPVTAEMRADERQLQIPDRKQARPQPAEAANAPHAKPRWEEIAAIEAPVPAEAVDQPRIDVPQARAPKIEAAQAEPVEMRPKPAETPRIAPQVDPAAKEIAAVEAVIPAQAVEGARPNGRKIQRLVRKVSRAASTLVRDAVHNTGPEKKMAPDEEKPRKRGASPLCALNLTPAEEEIAATVTPVPERGVLIPAEAVTKTRSAHPQPTSVSAEAPTQPAEATIAEEKIPAIDAAPPAIAAPVPAKADAETRRESGQMPGLDGSKKWKQLAAAMRELHVIPAAEEMNAIEAAIPAVELLGPAIPAHETQDDVQQIKNPAPENPVREKKRAQPVVAEGAQRIRPTEKDIAAIEASLPAEEALAPTRPAVKTRPVDRQMQAQDREMPRPQLAATPSVEREKPAEEQTAAINAAFPEPATPVAVTEAAIPEAEPPVAALVVAEETRVDARQAQTPDREKQGMELAATLTAPPEKPSAEKIAVTEAPIAVTDAPDTTVESPVPAKAAAGARREGRQKRSLENEKTWAQLAETLGALRAKPAAERLTVTEAPVSVAPVPAIETPIPVRQTADALHDRPPAARLDSEKTWAQLTETLTAMRARPAARETGANKATAFRKASPDVRRRGLQEQFQEEEDWGHIHAWATSRHYIPKDL